MIKGLLFLSILTTFGIILMIIFNIYHNTITPTTSEILTIKNLPINPNIDLKTAEKLKQRKIINVNLEEEKAAGITSANKEKEPDTNKEETEKTSTQSSVLNTNDKDL